MLHRLLMGGSALAVLVAQPALAQVASAPAVPTGAASDSEAPADIVVTGRKRAERLLDAPLSVTAFSEAKLDQLNLDNLTDISKVTPGFKFEQQAFQNGYRFLSQTRFRGMVASGPRPNTQVGAVFVDGVYVAAGAASIMTDDLERLEVIKGPQNAYFGRNTFAGAVNFITARPSDTFKGKFSAAYSSYNSYDLGGSIEGPIIDGVLNGRIMAKAWQRGTGYESGDGTEVGRQRTRAIAGSLLFTPSSALTVRLRASYQQDDDYGNLIENISATNGNCKNGSRVFFCGGAPKFGDTYTTFDGRQFTATQALVNQDTSLTPIPLVLGGRPNALRDLLNNTNGVLNDVPFIGKIPSIDHFGSVNHVFRMTGGFDYELGGGYTLSGSGGYGDLRNALLRDDDNTLGAARALNLTQIVYVPFRARDLTAELRVSSPRDKRLRVSVGANYFKQWLDGNLSSGGKTLVAGTGVITPFNNNDRDRTFATGIFGSVSYDILDNLTVDLEGRYQEDNSRQFTQISFDKYNPVNAKFSDFLPRAILTWKPTPRTTIYGSYSVGALTGVANTTVNNLVNRIAALPGNRLGTNNPDEIRRILGNLVGITSEVPDIVAAEKIDHYELGYKQSFWGGRGAFTLAGYHIQWRNMKQTSAVTVPDLDGDTQPDTIGPILPASSRIWGAEFELTVQPMDGLTLTANGELVDHKYTKYTLYGVAAEIVSNSSRAPGKGLTLIQYPKFSLFGSARYSFPVTTSHELYVGGEVSMTGKQYLDEGNQAYISPFTTANFRIGLQGERFNVEAFVLNAFNYDGPIGGRRNTLGDGTVGLTLYPAQKRSAGVRTTIKF